jgi:hypothetical protein
LFLLALMALYSLIGTIQGTREYYLVQKRLDHYLSLMRQLERIETRSQKQTEEDPTPDDRDALVYNHPGRAGREPRRRTESREPERRRPHRRERG